MDVTLVEVGPRDGFQSVGSFVPTDTKISLIGRLYRAGIRRMEVTSFVSSTAVPQFADAVEVLKAAQALPQLDAVVLVPTARQAERALRAGARHLVYVVSVSEEHNQNNVRRSTEESLDDCARMMASLPTGIALRISLSTAFDCPFEGRIAPNTVLRMVERVIAVAPTAEVALADTTGRATPGEVGGLFSAAAARFPQVRSWVFHGHDTFGMGAANCLSAWNAGVRVFDGSVSGLGGCPFAPGATGNVATEDLVWMFDGMGVQSGIQLDSLVSVAAEVSGLQYGQTGGRVRDAFIARNRRLNR